MSIGVTRRSTERLPELTSYTSRIPVTSAPEVSAPDLSADRAARVEPGPAILESGSTRDARAFASSDLSSADRMFASYRAKGGTSAKEGEDEVDAGAAVDAGTTAPLAPPPDLHRLDALCDAAEAYSGDAVGAERAAHVRTELRAAEAALREGNYDEARQHFANLGFPPAPDGSLSDAGADAALMIGGAHLSDGGISYSIGAHGDQALNDLVGFAANAEMMDTLDDAGIHCAGNPPTRDEARAYMERFAGDPAGALRASHMMIEGMVVHYSAAGAENPEYGADPRRFVLVTDVAGGERMTFATRREAEAAARERDLPISDVRAMTTHVPSDWDDATSMGTRAGRSIGDCESKAYLQAQLLDAAGFETLGAVTVDHGDSDHALGVFRDPSGGVWVTSNSDAYAVTGTGRDGAVTEGDIERTVHAATRETYGIAEHGSLAGFDFAYGAEPSTTTAEPGVESARRASENYTLDIDELFLTRPER